MFINTSILRENHYSSEKRDENESLFLALLLIVLLIGALK